MLAPRPGSRIRGRYETGYNVSIRDGRYRPSDRVELLETDDNSPTGESPRACRRPIRLRSMSLANFFPTPSC
jgi:hypothetical protein